MSSLTGHIDRVTRQGVISGWLVDVNSPDQPARATLLLDGVEAMSVVPGNDRPDVLAAGFRPVTCGFDVTVPNRFCDGREREISFRGADGTVTTLPGASFIRVERAIEGYAELSPDRKFVRGWAVDPSLPMRQLFIDLALDGEHVATVIGIRDPKSLQETSAGLLAVARFEVDLDRHRGSGLGSQELAVSVSGYGGTLTPEPLRIARADMLESSLFGFVAGSLVGWALDPTEKRPLPVSVFCDGELIAELTPTGYSADLAQRFNVVDGAFTLELPRHVYDGVPHVIKAEGVDGVELEGSPLTLTHEEQMLHDAIGALRANNSTSRARGYGFLSRDLDWITVGPGAQMLEAASAQVAHSMTTDFLHHTAFSMQPVQAMKLTSELLKGNVINYDDAAVASILIELVRRLNAEEKRNFVSILARPEHRARSFRAPIMAAMQFANGDTASAVGILFNVCGRPKVSDAMVRLCAEMLVQEGLTEEAKDLVFFSVVAKA